MVCEPKIFTIKLSTEKLCQPVLEEDTLSYFRLTSTITEKNLDPRPMKLQREKKKRMIFWPTYYVPVWSTYPGSPRNFLILAMNNLCSRKFFSPVQSGTVDHPSM